MPKFQNPIYLILCVFATVAGVKLYTYYIEKKAAAIVQKTEEQRIALEQAPLQQSTAVIQDIVYTPKHTKSVTYPAGKWKTRTQTYEVKESYTITFDMKGIHKPVSFTEYNINRGSQYKKGDRVQIDYKQIDPSLSSNQGIHILDFRTAIKQ